MTSIKTQLAAAVRDVDGRVLTDAEAEAVARVAERFWQEEINGKPFVAPNAAARHVRIAWHIAGASGNGQWLENTADVRKSLLRWVDLCDEKHGPGTHWLEERA